MASNCTKALNHFCLQMLVSTISESSSVHIIDLVLLVPALLFVVLLLLTSKQAIRRLKETSSQLMTTFYVLVCIEAAVITGRSAISAYLNSQNKIEEHVDRILWLLVRFMTLFIEMVIIVFCLGFSHLDSRSSIRRVLIITSCIAFTYSTAETLCEFLIENDKYKFHHGKADILLYQHGGNWFLLVSSLTFSMVYSFVLVMPLTPLRNKISLPTKIGFYIYCFILSLLNLLQLTGALLFCFNILIGRCFVNFATLIYFVILNPLIYFIFLRPFFSDRTVIERAHYPVYISVSTDSDVMNHNIRGGGGRPNETMTDRRGVVKNPLMESSGNLVCEDVSDQEFSLNGSMNLPLPHDPTYVGVPELLFNRDSGRHDKTNTINC